MDAAGDGIELAERPLAADVRVHPRVGERGEISAGRILVEAVAADARPRRVRVLVAVGRRRQRNVVERRKLPPDPRACIVLIGDRVDAQLRDDRVDLGRRQGRLHVQERLGQRVRSAPREHPERARIGLLRRSDDQLGTRTHLVRADRRHAIRRLTRYDHGLERRRAREPRLVLQQLRPHLTVGGDERLDDVGPHLVLHPGRCRRNQPFDVELVRVDEQPHHRHLIVGLVGDVGHDDHALLLHVRIDADREWIRAQWLRAERRQGDAAEQRADDPDIRGQREPPVL